MQEIKSNQTLLSRQIAAVPLALGFLTLLFFAPVLFTPDDLGGSDFREIHYPLLKFLVDEVQSGNDIPLWNPHQFLGYSVVGNPQNGLLYPPNWLLLLFPAESIYDGVAWLVALHVWWMAYGMAIFCRLWGANRVGALVGGATLAFGGFVGSKIYAGHYAVLMTMAWIPWLYVGYVVAIRYKSVVSIAWGGIALGAAILAGHPQFVYIGGVGFGILWLYHLMQSSSRHKFMLATRQAILISLLGLVLGAGSWVPTLRYQQETVRGQADDSLDFANQHAVPPDQLLTIILPDVFGLPIDDAGYWGEPFYEEMTAYAGWLPLLLLIWGVGKRERWLAFGFIAVGLLLALGVNGGLYVLQYYLVPPARGFRAPGRFLLLTSIGFGLIAALGITQLQSHAERYRWQLPLLLRRVGLPLLIMCVGGAIGFTLLQGDIADDPAQADYVSQQLGWAALFLSVTLLALVAWQWQQQAGILLMAGVAILNVWVLSWPLLQAQPANLSSAWQSAAVISTDDPARVMQVGAPVGIVNGASWTGHYTPQGYDPIAPSGWFALMDATGPFIEDPGSATNRLFGVRYVITGQPLENYGFGSAQFFDQIATENGVYYYDNPLALARAYVTEEIEVVPNDELAIQRIQQGAVDRGELILLSSDAACELSGRGGTATFTAYQPNTVTIDVQADGNGILVLTDQYDADWRVFVDDKPAELLRVNTTFRGVCVPDGASVVEFRYHPQAFYAGALVSAMGWLMMIVILGWAFMTQFVFAK